MASTMPEAAESQINRQETTPKTGLKIPRYLLVQVSVPLTKSNGTFAPLR